MGTGAGSSDTGCLELRQRAGGSLRAPSDAIDPAQFVGECGAALRRGSARAGRPSSGSSSICACIASRVICTARTACAPRRSSHRWSRSASRPRPGASRAAIGSMRACKLRAGDTRGLAGDDQHRRVGDGILLNDDGAGVIGDRARRWRAMAASCSGLRPRNSGNTAKCPAKRSNDVRSCCLHSWTQNLSPCKSTAPAAR